MRKFITKSPTLTATQFFKDQHLKIPIDGVEQSDEYKGYYVRLRGNQQVVCDGQWIVVFDGSPEKYVIPDDIFRQTYREIVTVK